MGADLRLLEALRMRVKDLSLHRGEVIVRHHQHEKSIQRAVQAAVRRGRPVPILAARSQPALAGVKWASICNSREVRVQQ